MDSYTSYARAASDGLLITDGAFGTYIQERNLSAADFGGEELEGCNEILCLTRPEIISEMHREFLSIGVNVINTATFGAFSVPLQEYSLQDKTAEINREAARLAREAADSFQSEETPRWVSGSMGPGTKMASLGQISYRDLLSAHQEQAEALLEGGIDFFLIETQFDLLGAKAAINGCRAAMTQLGREIPIQVQITIELTGQMLPGTETSAALAALAPMKPDVIGLNCATGPAEMGEHLRVLCQGSKVPVSCIPNAGLPRVEGGKTVYDLGPEELAEHLARYVSELGVSVVGGCCGTTPEHLAAVVEKCAGLKPKKREVSFEPAVSSLYNAVNLRQDASLLMVGERTNTNGSRLFSEALDAGDLDSCVKIGKDQVSGGAHVLDLCVDYVGRDGARDMDKLASRFVREISAPLILDSTEPEVLVAGLQWIGGRAILNSANLEDGEGEGSRADRVFRLAREFGAGVICLLIDEEGQARDFEWKMRVARRLHGLAVEKYGLDPADLIFDTLVFPLSTGDDDLRKDGMATIQAIERISTEFPESHTILGISNVSFGLNSPARIVLNSVFLNECMKVGLTSAIVNAKGIIPLNRMDEEQKETCLDLIWDRRGDEGRAQKIQSGKGGGKTDSDYDPLKHLISIFQDADDIQLKSQGEDRSDWPVERILSQRIIEGDSKDLEADLALALKSHSALEIVNNILLDGMKTVGELFGSGQMQLPFVLASAETMKAAVAWLEPHMEKTGEADASRKGKIVLATVKGDVHDIGKNLVDIILTNNGYLVENLGIKISINEMIEKALEIDADAIGMSGLLVKSTLIMRDNLEELNNRQLSNLPVILGGAALTRRYVEHDLRQVYEGRLFYGKDAFDGLAVMEDLTSGEELEEDYGKKILETVERKSRDETATKNLPARSPEVESDNKIFEPPFFGSQILKGFELETIASYLNETALFRNQWQYRPEKGESDGEFKERTRPILRKEMDLAHTQNLLNPAVAYGYFPANSRGDDLIIWTDKNRGGEKERFSFPRQPKPPHLCIADFFRPEEAETDYAGFFIVTMGSRISEATAELFAQDKYQEYLLLHGLGVEMAEALAELMHKRMREELGFASEDGPDVAGLFRQQYRGGRYSAGYPACPDLQDCGRVANLLEAERLGIEVSEDTGWEYQPEQTTSALVCHHPKAKYFVVR